MEFLKYFMKGLVFVFSLLIMSSIAFSLNYDELFARYSFNSNANDSSGNENHATVYGATLTTDRNNISNRAYDFDGINDYINTNINNLNSSSIGVGYWYQSSYTAQHGLLTSDGNNRLEIIHNHGNPNVVRIYIKENNVPRIKKDTTIPDLNDGNWHFIFINFDLNNHSNTKLYFDGSKQNLSDLSTQSNGAELLGTLDNHLVIGAYNSWNNGIVQEMDGKVDEVSIWLRNLNETEVLELYNMEEENCPIEDGEVINYSVTFEEEGIVCNLPNGFSIEGENITVDCRNAELNTPSNVFINATQHSNILNCAFNVSTLNVGLVNLTFQNVNFEGFNITFDCGEWCSLYNVSFQILQLIADSVDLSGSTVTIKAPPMNTSSWSILLPYYIYNWELGYELVNFQQGIEEINLDCNNGIINGSRLENSTGLYVNTVNVSVTVKNCYFQNYDTNVHLDNFVGDYFINNTMRYAMSRNMRIGDATSATFKNVDILVG